jgi:hypothetical protein
MIRRHRSVNPGVLALDFLVYAWGRTATGGNATLAFLVAKFGPGILLSEY